MQSSPAFVFAAFVVPLASLACQEEKAAQDTRPTSRPTTEKPMTPDKAAADKAIVAIDEFIKKEKINTSGAGWKPKVTAPPDKSKVAFDPAKKYFWKLDTNKGEIK